MYYKINKMKTLLATLFLITIFTLTSCKDHEEYPYYSITTVDYIPDSLKTKHRTWITETIRAASQNMTGGDYEDIDDTIRESKETANEIFSTKTMALKKEINDNYWEDIIITPKDFSDYEEKVFDSLKNK